MSVSESIVAPSARRDGLDSLDALFVGSLFCDLVFHGAEIPEPGQEVYASGFALAVGGVANAGVASARHGLATGIVGLIGGDPLSDFVHSTLAREPRLRLDWLTRDAAATIPVSVALTNEHDRAFITYEEPQPEPTVSSEHPLPGVSTCHVGLDRAGADWICDLRDAGTSVYAGVGWDASAQWDQRSLALLDHVDVFVPNEGEAVNYTRSRSVEEAARALAEQVPLVVVTLGKAGAMAIDSANGRLVSVPAVPVRAVDPTGAGDVFTASLMAASVFGWPLETRLRFACLSASLSVRSLGGAASAPCPDQIVSFIEAQGAVGEWGDILDWARSRVEASGGS